MASTIITFKSLKFGSTTWDILSQNIIVIMHVIIEVIAHILQPSFEIVAIFPFCEEASSSDTSFVIARGIPKRDTVIKNLNNVLTKEKEPRNVVPNFLVIYALVKVSIILIKIVEKLSLKKFSRNLFTN